MATSLFDQPRFKDADSAREHLEFVRWPQGPVCPHCGAVDRITKLQGKSHRPGLYDCGHCRDQFTVTVGTVFERSKIPLHKWLMAATLFAASKKGMSAHQLHRMLGVTYKTAWFMAHRLREAMADEPTGQLGGGGKHVEADETYWGKIKGAPKKAGYQHKMKIVALVERGGKVRSFHVPAVNANTLRDVLHRHIAKDSILNTDEHAGYRRAGAHFARHNIVNHTAGEYSRGDATTNNIEAFFSVMKRGLVGTFHHVGEQHLQRYIAEFDFRYNFRSALGVEDAERADYLLKGISGKRLMYGGPRQVEAPAA